MGAPALDLRAAAGGPAQLAPPATARARKVRGAGVFLRGTRVVCTNGIVEGRVDLRTEYLGLQLPHPLVVGASPLTDDLDMARRLEDAGAAALVMRSLFAEQIVHENVGAYRPSEEGRSVSWNAAFVLPSRAYVDDPGRVPRAARRAEGRARHPGHRVPQWLRARAVAGVRAAARGHRRRRHRAEPAARGGRGLAVVGGDRGHARGDRPRRARAR